MSGRRSPPSSKLDVAGAIEDLARFQARKPEAARATETDPGDDPLVRVNAELDIQLDVGCRFLRCLTGRQSWEGKPWVTYEFFRSGLGVAAPPKVAIGSQYTYLDHTYDAATGASTGPKRYCCNVQKGVVYGIPWGGSSPPSSVIPASLVVTGDKGAPSLGALQKDGADYAGTYIKVAQADEWGAPYGRMGSASSAAVDNTPEQESGWFPPGPKWTVTPFFFYKGAENACLDFLQMTFDGATAGSGADSLTREHARRCITDQSHFSALVVVKRIFAVGHVHSDMRTTWQTVAGLDQTDAERSRWTSALLGHQNVLIR